MQQEIEVEVPDSQAYISFYHNEIPYVIYQTVNFEEGEDVESQNLRLSEVVVVNDANRAAGTPEVVTSTNNFVTDKSDALTISEEFKVLVNEYFAALGGGDNTFPVSGSNYEQYDWIVGSGFSFSNGILSLTVV